MIKIGNLINLTLLSSIGIKIHLSMDVSDDKRAEIEVIWEF